MVRPHSNWAPRGNAPELRDFDVHVWRIDLDPGEERVATCRRLLNAEETARAARFHFAADRDRFIAARGQLRALLGAYLQHPPEKIAFTYGSHGKPFLADRRSGVEFNLAHSRDLALAAVARGREVGVDVEHLCREISVAAIAARFFSEDEAAAVLALDEVRRRKGFFNCWTRKEAFLKAKGMGISFGLGQFSVSASPGDPPALLATPYDPEEAKRWRLFHLRPHREYVGALAVPAPAGRVHTWRFTPG